jgi:hypothetical protein
MSGNKSLSNSLTKHNRNAQKVCKAKRSKSSVDKLLFRTEQQLINTSRKRLEPIISSTLTVPESKMNQLLTVALSSARSVCDCNDSLGSSNYNVSIASSSRDKLSARSLGGSSTYDYADSSSLFSARSSARLSMHELLTDIEYRAKNGKA